MLTCHELSAASVAELAEMQPAFWDVLRNFCLLRAAAMGVSSLPGHGGGKGDGDSGPPVAVRLILLSSTDITVYDMFSRNL
jgi:hypothetical protein